MNLNRGLTGLVAGSALALTTACANLGTQGHYYGNTSPQQRSEYSSQNLEVSSDSSNNQRNRESRRSLINWHWGFDQSAFALMATASLLGDWKLASDARRFYPDSASTNIMLRPLLGKYPTQSQINTIYGTAIAGFVFSQIVIPNPLRELISLGVIGTAVYSITKEVGFGGSVQF